MNESQPTTEPAIPWHHVRDAKAQEFVNSLESLKRAEETDPAKAKYARELLIVGFQAGFEEGRK